MTAWEKGYNFLADLLIEAEANLYRVTKEQEGGWEGPREFIIEDIMVEAYGIKSFYLKPKDGGKLPLFLPG